MKNEILIGTVIAPIVFKLKKNVESLDNFLRMNPELDKHQFYILDRKIIYEKGDYLQFKSIPFKYPSRYFVFTTIMLN